MPDTFSTADGTVWQIEVTADAEVEQHPNCPVCGHEGCEINHLAEKETGQ